MIEITNKTSTGKIHLIGLSISTDNDKNFVEVKMNGNEDEIAQMIVNTINDGLHDDGTRKTTESLINVLSNTLVGVCMEQHDHFLAAQLIRDLNKIINDDESVQ